MRVFAVKTADGGCMLVQGEGELVLGEKGLGGGAWRIIADNATAEPYCRDMEPGTSREFWRLDLISGEHEFMPTAAPAKQG